MIYVIGSGPAGISAAMALVKKGHEITMLDVGFDLEPERKEIVDHLRSLDRKMWEDASVRALKQNMVAGLNGVELKTAFGSDFPYRGIRRYQPLGLINASMVRSLAKGGLSNVWGASIFPFRDSDMEDWPINLKDLEPHYRAVLSFMPSCGRDDSLKNLFPLYKEKIRSFSRCRQATAFLEDLQRNEKALKAEGFLFGLSRLAVKFSDDDEGAECSYCGMCLYGCAYGNIYSTSATLKQLMGYEKFHYENNILVEKLVELERGVEIQARSLVDSGDIRLRGSRVFLAAGLLSSTRILLQSIEAFDQPLMIKHSEHFQIPLIRYEKIPDVTREDLHTLTQLSIALLDPYISEHTVFMQIYCYNDLYLEAINLLPGPLAPVFKRFIEKNIGRLLFIKGYLHSSLSSGIRVRLEPGLEGRLIVEGYPNQRAKTTLRRVVTKLFRNQKYFRATPFPFMGGLGAPGRGNHSGGSFPMSKKPKEFETDTLGRPFGFENVNVVDSTIFPTVPATTITLTIMANAHRIASNY
jgi:choline dehydrogenase-like flavoprotein